MEGRTELESQPKERENLEGMLGLDEEDSVTLETVGCPGCKQQ